MRLLRVDSILSSAANTFQLLVCILAWHVTSACLSVHSDGLFHLAQKSYLAGAATQNQQREAHRSCASAGRHIFSMISPKEAQPRRVHVHQCCRLQPEILVRALKPSRCSQKGAVQARLWPAQLRPVPPTPQRANRQNARDLSDGTAAPAQRWRVLCPSSSEMSRRNRATLRGQILRHTERSECRRARACDAWPQRRQRGDLNWPAGRTEWTRWWQPTLKAEREPDRRTEPARASTRFQPARPAAQPVVGAAQTEP